MAARLSLACENYFSGFRDLSAFNKKNSTTKALTALKIVSYFTLIFPLFFAMLYCVSSLVGRVTVPTNTSPQDKRIASAAQQVVVQHTPTLEEQLDTLFGSSVKTLKLFTIEGSKVGVMFSPQGEPLHVGFITVEDPVVLISDRAIPDQIAARITAKIPANRTHSTLCIGTINGQSPFKTVGLE